MATGWSARYATGPGSRREPSDALCAAGHASAESTRESPTRGESGIGITDGGNCPAARTTRRHLALSGGWPRWPRMSHSRSAERRNTTTGARKTWRSEFASGGMIGKRRDTARTSYGACGRSSRSSGWRSSDSFGTAALGGGADASPQHQYRGMPGLRGRWVRDVRRYRRNRMG